MQCQVSVVGCSNWLSPTVFVYLGVVHCTTLHFTAVHCTLLHCNALFCTALHCTALHCIALHCTALHCTALHCTVALYASFYIGASISIGREIRCLPYAGVFFYNVVALVCRGSVIKGYTPSSFWF